MQLGSEDLKVALGEAIFEIWYYQGIGKESYHDLIGLIRARNVSNAEKKRVFIGALKVAFSEGDKKLTDTKVMLDDTLKAIEQELTPSEKKDYIDGSSAEIEADVIAHEFMRKAKACKNKSDVKRYTKPLSQSLLEYYEGQDAKKLLPSQERVSEIVMQSEPGISEKAGELVSNAYAQLKESMKLKALRRILAEKKETCLDEATKQLDIIVEDVPIEERQARLKTILKTVEEESTGEESKEHNSLIQSAWMRRQMSVEEVEPLVREALTDKKETVKGRQERLKELLTCVVSPLHNYKAAVQRIAAVKESILKKDKGAEMRLFDEIAEEVLAEKEMKFLVEVLTSKKPNSEKTNLFADIVYEIMSEKGKDNSFGELMSYLRDTYKNDHAMLLALTEGEKRYYVLKKIILLRKTALTKVSPAEKEAHLDKILEQLDSIVESIHISGDEAKQFKQIVIETARQTSYNEEIEIIALLEEAWKRSKYNPSDPAKAKEIERIKKMKIDEDIERKRKAKEAEEERVRIANLEAERKRKERDAEEARIKKEQEDEAERKRLAKIEADRISREQELENARKKKEQDDEKERKRLAKIEADRLKKEADDEKKRLAKQETDDQRKEAGTCGVQGRASASGDPEELPA
jgi:hypothetical protein